MPHRPSFCRTFLSLSLWTERKGWITGHLAWNMETGYYGIQYRHFVDIVICCLGKGIDLAGFTIV